MMQRLQGSTRAGCARACRRRGARRSTPSPGPAAVRARTTGRTSRGRRSCRPPPSRAVAGVRSAAVRTRRRRSATTPLSTTTPSSSMPSRRPCCSASTGAGPTSELQASRRRIATASATERRRIERDLHDSAQQQLVALRIHLDRASERLGRDEELEQVGVGLEQALRRDPGDRPRRLPGCPPRLRGRSRADGGGPLGWPRPGEGRPARAVRRGGRGGRLLLGARSAPECLQALSRGLAHRRRGLGGRGRRALRGPGRRAGLRSEYRAGGRRPRRHARSTCGRGRDGRDSFRARPRHPCQRRGSRADAIDAQTEMLTGDVAIQISVPRKTKQPSASVIVRSRTSVSLGLSPAKKSETEKRTTPRT